MRDIEGAVIARECVCVCERGRKVERGEYWTFFLKTGIISLKEGLFVCLFGFLTSSSTTRLYRGRAPRQSV